MLTFKQFMLEDGEGGSGGVPANNVGSGNVAGTVPGETPPVTTKRQKKYTSQNAKQAAKIAPQLRKRRVMDLM